MSWFQQRLIAAPDFRLEKSNQLVLFTRLMTQEILPTGVASAR